MLMDQTICDSEQNEIMYIGACLKDFEEETVQLCLIKQITENIDDEELYILDTSLK